MPQRPSRIPSVRQSWPWLTVAALLLGACDGPEPVTYEIPKEDRSAGSPPPAAGPPAATSGDPPSGGPAENAPDIPAGGGAPGSGGDKGMEVLPGMEQAAETAPEIDYDVPEAWEEFPPSGIRQANFRIDGEEGGAEVTVLVFPGDVGGALANVNRWRGQIGLDPIDGAELRELRESRTISNHPGFTVRMNGTSESVFAAVLPFHGSTWFFKMQGTIATVLDQEDAMKRFLDSVRIEDRHH